MFYKVLQPFTAGSEAYDAGAVIEVPDPGREAALLQAAGDAVELMASQPVTEDAESVEVSPRKPRRKAGH